LVTGLVLLRQNYVFARPQFIWEETAAFWATTFTLDPLRYLVEPWSGYLVVPVRAAFLIARLGPPEIAPAITVLLHAVAIGLVAAFLASGRLAVAIPDRRVRLAFALSIAVLPIISPYLSVASSQWFFAIALTGMSLSPTRRWDYPVLAITCLSGPAVLLALPLFWRAWRPVAWRVIDPRGVLMAGFALLQMASLGVSEGRPIVFFVAPVVLTLLLMMGVALIAARSLPAATHLSFGYLAVVTFVLGLFAMGMWGRYFLALWALVALAALAALVQRRAIGIALTTWFVVVAAGAFFAVTPRDLAWGANAHCIGGPVPCRVPADPPEWSVTWPGDPSLYVAPKDWILNPSE
jgi:hypothetical protein